MFLFGFVGTQTWFHLAVSLPAGVRTGQNSCSLLAKPMNGKPEYASQQGKAEQDTRAKRGCW
jgi:hypothetical protein